MSTLPSSLTMGVEEHESRARTDQRSRRLEVAVVTVSDTRTEADDKGGDLVATLLARADHRVSRRHLVPDDPDAIDRALRDCLADHRIRAVLLTGGTGIAPRDGTVEVVRRHLRLELPGYGELVRRLGVDEVGPAAILSRSIAGVAPRPGPGLGPDVLVFTMPGSVQAVESAMSGAIIPILPHAAWQLDSRSG